MIKRSFHLTLICLLSLILLTAIDLWSKRWAEETLSKPRTNAYEKVPLCKPNKYGQILMQRIRTQHIVLIPGYLEFRYAENCGAAFGMLHNAPMFPRYLLFITAVTIAVTTLLWMFIRGSGGPFFAYSVPLVVSGALGNLIDRVRNGYVVDFVRFYIYDIFEWPTFNFADAAITVGVIFLLLDGLRKPAVESTPVENVTEVK